MGIAQEASVSVKEKIEAINGFISVSCWSLGELEDQLFNVDSLQSKFNRSKIEEPALQVDSAPLATE